MSSNLLTLCAAIFKATTQWKEVVLRAYLRGDALRRTRTIEADQDHRGGPGPSRRTRTIEADQDQRGDTSRTRRPRKDEVYQCVGRGRTSEATEEEQRVGRGGQGRTRCTRESDVEGRARRRWRSSEATEEDERGDVGGRARRLGRTTVGEQRGAVYQEERERASENTTVRSVFEEHRYFEQEAKQRYQIQTTTAATRADYQHGDEQAILSSISYEL
ncbi:uncharacterized protein LOC142661429 [Rhinoderma darwinii]|uniref:uncharacterized protein LOC142661429 n=1 Tax=Rhinoderma darwinii TaxID=43563 RepID=UPI003F663B58